MRDIRGRKPIELFKLIDLGGFNENRRRRRRAENPGGCVHVRERWISAATTTTTRRWRQTTFAKLTLASQASILMAHATGLVKVEERE